jgi:hypothetical protein
LGRKGNLYGALLYIYNLSNFDHKTPSRNTDENFRCDLELKPYISAVEREADC